MRNGKGVNESDDKEMLARTHRDNPAQKERLQLDADFFYFRLKCFPLVVRVGKMLLDFFSV